MPRTIPSRLGAACALALILVLSSAAIAVAKGPLANMRVVAGQKVLADKTFGASTTSVPTSKAADCFGKESAGSGKAVKVDGPTPLGMLATAARTTKSLRPLLVTDAFSFGLGLCAIGGIEPKGEGFWQLRVNHKAPSVGGDAVKLKSGDEVLWYLATGFPAAEELSLTAPERAIAGEEFEVRVFAYDEKGKREPAAGVKVTGAKGKTGADGRATVVLSGPIGADARLIARRGKDIPSNREAVCVGRQKVPCAPPET